MVKWPCEGTIEDYIQHFLKHIDAYLCQADTYLVFDRCIKNSIKEVIRGMQTGNEASRKYQLSLSTPLPPQKVCLSVTQIKCQLINLFFQYIFGQGGKILSSYKLVFESDPIPLKVNNGKFRATRKQMSLFHIKLYILQRLEKPKSLFCQMIHMFLFYYFLHIMKII